MMAAAEPCRTSGPFTHVGLLYRDSEEYLAGVGSFIEEGVAAGEPVLVTAPPAEVDALRARLGERVSASVQFADMVTTGANPARIIPWVRSFVDQWPGRRTRAVGQPTWPGLSPAATREINRMEALTNLAFAQTPATFLCPYRLDGSAVPGSAEPLRTHPQLLRGHTRAASADYSPAGLLVGGQPEPEPAPPHARSMQVSAASQLADLRRFVSWHANQLSLPAPDVGTFVVAVGEAATNALEHGGGKAQVTVWGDADEDSLICEVRSTTRIDDPMIGCVQPPATRSGGWGMWLVNQLCELAETHSGSWGTAVRMHVKLPDPTRATAAAL